MDLLTLLKNFDASTFQDGALGLDRYNTLKQLLRIGKLIFDEDAAEQLKNSHFPSGENAFDTLNKLYLILNEKTSELEKLHWAMISNTSNIEEGAVSILNGDFKLEI